MATGTGKEARKRGGNRFDCKRASKRNNPAKVARWNAMERERLARGGPAR
jgi:hypothetical protein